MSPRFVRRFSLAALVLSLLGCAHYQMPVSNLETPEAHGGGIQDPRLGRIELGLLSGVDLIAQPNLSYPPADSPGPPTPMTQSAFAPALTFSFSLGEKTDLGLRLMPQAPPTLRFKYQWLGAAEKQAASGDFSAALCLSPGLLLGRDGAQSTVFFMTDFSLPVGYRLGPSHLFTLAPFFGFASLSGLSQSVDSLAPGSLSTSRMGAALGYRFSLEAFFIDAELAYASGSAGSAKISGIFAGASAGFGL